MNTDGTVAANGHAECGGVMRGEQGEWVQGFSCKVRTDDALTTEA